MLSHHFLALGFWRFFSIIIYLFIYVYWIKLIYNGVLITAVLVLKVRFQDQCVFFLPYAYLWFFFNCWDSEKIRTETPTLCPPNAWHLLSMPLRSFLPTPPSLAQRTLHSFTLSPRSAYRNHVKSCLQILHFTLLYALFLLSDLTEARSQSQQELPSCLCFSVCPHPNPRG